jgi:hypothetical protein
MGIWYYTNNTPNLKYPKVEFLKEANIILIPAALSIDKNRKVISG